MRALSIRERALSADHPQVASPFNNLGNVHAVMGLYSEAKALHERALAIREKVLKPDYPSVAMSLNNLGNLHRADHPSVATSLSNLGNVYRKTGEDAEAIALYERALAIWEKTLGVNHPRVATSLYNLANIYRRAGKYAEAKTPSYPISQLAEFG